MIDFKTSITVPKIDWAPHLAALSAAQMNGWTTIQPPDPRLEDYAAQIKKNAEVLVVIGIGGSFLGAKALLDAIPRASKTEVIFAGTSLSPLEMSQKLAELGDRDFCINVISKSGGTLETNLAFDVFYQKLHQKYGTDASQRVYATTGRSGALFQLASDNHWSWLEIPDNVGGRYSVLTSVGLLPLAVGGVNITELLNGAKNYAADISKALDYAAFRIHLHSQGYLAEALATFEPELHFLAEWWKQLFGESEGKNHLGLLPTSLTYSTDLHSLGQFIQEGNPKAFETFLEIAPTASNIKIQGVKGLEGKDLATVNAAALRATVAAHATVRPIAEIQLPSRTAADFGAFLYFCFIAASMSAFALGLNPFNQPGVEVYKSNLQKLLGLA
ncbi:MAG: glucose-6-phosphate isomerase [Candidatus Nomurabacteria bacterium]|jgi:glucose-6-phosphate isomerase|nr:glucose-6-phosphate isomerase [Candidatus Nomurabacteria bacterium]